MKTVRPYEEADCGTEIADIGNMTQIRVGISTLHVIPGQSGSHEPYLRSLVHALSNIDSRNEYVIFVSSANKNLFHVRQSNFRQVVIPGNMALRPYRILCEQLIGNLFSNTLGLDVCHFPGNTLPLTLECPSVVTAHFIATEQLSLPWYKRVFWNFMMPRSFRRADCVIAVSRVFAQELINAYDLDPQRVWIIPHGIASSFTARSPTRRDSDLLVDRYRIHRPFILTVGSDLRYKNTSTVIRAFELLKRKYDVPHKLVVVGTSGNYFCTESDEGLKNDVVFTGYVPHDHLLSFYLLCDLFVSPSLQESFGMPILEAMACGVPVIVSNLEVFHEIAGEAAVYVSPTDPCEIAASIHTLIQDDSLRQRCVRLGKERAKAFTWESTAAKTLAAYHWAYEHPRQKGTVTF